MLGEEGLVLLGSGISCRVCGGLAQRPLRKWRQYDYSFVVYARFRDDFVKFFNNIFIFITFICLVLKQNRVIVSLNFFFFGKCTKFLN